MNDSNFRNTLQTATIRQLADIIDWLRRPWAPTQNANLRAAWHRVREGATGPGVLVAAIEREVNGFAFDPRDCQYVAERLGAPATAAGIASAIGQRLAPAAFPACSPVPDPVTVAVNAAVTAVAALFGAPPRAPRRSRRGYRHG